MSIRMQGRARMIVGLIVGLGAQAASAAFLNLAPSADSYVGLGDFDEPLTNYGTAPTLELVMMLPGPITTQAVMIPGPIRRHQGTTFRDDDSESDMAPAVH